MRGFDIRGIGPRVIRYGVDNTDPANPKVITDSNSDRGQIDDALGGRAYYQGRLELDIPLGTGAKELGLRPSIFLDVGSVFSVKRPTLTTLANFRDPADGLTKTSVPQFDHRRRQLRYAGAGRSRWQRQHAADPRRRLHKLPGRYDLQPLAVRANVSSATRGCRASRSAPGSTGTLLSVLSGSISLTPFAKKRAMTPNASHST